MARRLKKRSGQSGQTSVEYLLLLTVAFITAYIVITGPVATFASGMINGIKAGLFNVVQNAELSTTGTGFGNAGHPSDPERMKPLHL